MWNTITIEEPPAILASEEEIEAFEERMQLALPADHREFLKKFGEGVLFNYFRIFGLDKITAEAKDFQDRWQEYFLWEDPGSALKIAQMANCVIIGDNFNGDELVVSHDYPGEVFYFPQDEEQILRLGPSLEDALVKLVHQQTSAIEQYPEEEREEWDLRPVFNRASF
ncbi:SMI1/KNR4 family protein [Janthinobacterium sp. RB2R34]